jgi:hypothetical protein
MLSVATDGCGGLPDTLSAGAVTAVIASAHNAYNRIEFFIVALSCVANFDRR